MNMTKEILYNKFINNFSCVSLALYLYMCCLNSVTVNNPYPLLSFQSLKEKMEQV